MLHMLTDRLRAPVGYPSLPVARIRVATRIAGVKMVSVHGDHGGCAARSGSAASAPYLLEVLTGPRTNRSLVGGHDDSVDVTTNQHNNHHQNRMLRCDTCIRPCGVLARKTFSDSQQHQNSITA